MGNLFGKEKSKDTGKVQAQNAHKVTAQDRAVLKLKKQRDQMKKYQTKIEGTMKNLTAAAKKMAINGNKKGAMQMLKRRKYQEKLMEDTDKMLFNLEEMVNNIDFAKMEAQVVEGLEAGNTALKHIQEEMSLEHVEEVMDDLADNLEWSDAVTARITESVTPQDGDDLLAELDALAALDGAEASTEPAQPVELPSVPTTALVVETPDPSLAKPAEARVAVAQ